MSVFEFLKLMDASQHHTMYSEEFCYTNIPAQSLTEWILQNHENNQKPNLILIVQAEGKYRKKCLITCKEDFN